jgi:hypothetical protein
MAHTQRIIFDTDIGTLFTNVGKGNSANFAITEF